MRVRSLMMVAVALAFLGNSSQAGVNLVTNGSFETGDFTGWTQFGDTSYTGVAGNFIGVNPEDGSYQAYFGPTGSIGGISQNLATVVGQTYDISFYLYNFGDFGEGGTEYMVTFGSTTLVDVVNPPAFDYTQFNYVVTATSTSTSLAFGFIQPPAYFLLDNVSVTAAPEPSTLISSGMACLFGLGYGWRRRKAKAIA